MIESSKTLKTKIDEFYSRFTSKEKIIVYEENKFDVIIGLVFNKVFNLALTLIKQFIKITMKVLNKFFDIITQQSELKKRILKQEEILINNSKLNSSLSEQIRLLNKKIDKISLQNNSNDEDHVENKIINSFNDNQIQDQSNNKIEFFQNENLRISNELFETKKKFDIMKEEVEKFQNQRSNLIEKINSVNDVIQDSNVVTNVFENEQMINKIDIADPNKNNKKNFDLNSEVSKIFNTN